jgi:polyribonucleotide 5'-hydroxyl-kinase
MIINTSGLIRDEGYKSIVYAAREFDVNMILVIDQERLCVDLKKDLPDSIKVLCLPKSGGVVSKSQELRTNTRNTRIREYFYGVKSNFYPYSFDVKFNDAKIFRIGTPNLPDSLLPVGMSREENNTRVYRITPCK